MWDSIAPEQIEVAGLSAIGSAFMGAALSVQDSRIRRKMVRETLGIMATSASINACAGFAMSGCLMRWFPREPMFVLCVTMGASYVFGWSTSRTIRAVRDEAGRRGVGIMRAAFRGAVKTLAQQYNDEDSTSGSKSSQHDGKRDERSHE